jgi:hypothetical protein
VGIQQLAEVGTNVLLQAATLTCLSFDQSLISQMLSDANLLTPKAPAPKALLLSVGKIRQHH